MDVTTIETKKNEKIALVVEGGGMKCAYSAGVLDGFLDYAITFPYAIGVSAGSANLVSYLAKQQSRAARFYTKHIKEPDYFGFRSLLKTGNLFGLQYIYGTLTNSDGDDPLDYETMMASDTDFHIVATDAKTGKPVYFQKKQLQKDNYLEIMASCAIPVVSRPVKINGRRYFDGGLSDALPIKKAWEEGCSKAVVISSKTRDYIKPAQKFSKLYKAVVRKYPKVVETIERRHIMYWQQQEYMYKMEKQGRVFVFNPSRSLKMSTYDMNPEENQALYQLGVEDFQRNKEALLAFMGK